MDLLKELISYDIPRINLSEVFQTKFDLKWKSNNNEHRAKFDLDGYTYTLHIDEYDIDLIKTYTMLDLGFSYDTETNSSQDITNFNKNTSKILGIVSNGLHEKLKNISYDILVFGAHTKNHKVDSRMRIYEFLAKKYMKLEGMTMYKMEDSDQQLGKYIIMSNIELSKEDLDIIQTQLDK
jgi:hypothetical protein